jgi:hypothetical protein
VQEKPTYDEILPRFFADVNVPCLLAAPPYDKCFAQYGN